MTKSKQNKKRKTTKFYKVLSFILLLFTVFAASCLVYFEVLPVKYLIILGVIFSIIIFYIIYKLNVRTNLFTKLVCSLFSFIFIFIEIVGSIYAFGTIDFFNDIFDTGLRTETYGIYVLNDSNYSRIKDLNNKNIAVKIDEEEQDSIDKALNKLASKIKYEKSEFDSITDASFSLENEECDALFVNETLMNVYLEEHDNNIKLLDTIEITTKDTSEFKSVNVTKKPFVVYISGVDNSGKVAKSSRSDVNILAIVNPENGKILLINTPRDYYVALASNNKYDKLTHAGIYGTSESAKTLGNLYDVDVNYYVRVNFTSFIKIIDNLGGIEVDVEKPDYRYNLGIDCGSGYVCEQNSKREFGEHMIYIKSGKQTLNGEEALAYARNRHQYNGGDIARGRHQAQILEAIVKKASSPSILTKYNSILKSLSSGILTNIEQKTITKLINNQLDKNIKWEIELFSVKGKDDYAECYSTGKSKAYVLRADEESLAEAKDKIKEVINIEK